MTDRLANESLTEFDRTFRVSACTLAGEVGEVGEVGEAGEGDGRGPSA